MSALGSWWRQALILMGVMVIGLAPLDAAGAQGGRSYFDSDEYMLCDGELVYAGLYAVGDVYPTGDDAFDSDIRDLRIEEGALAYQLVNESRLDGPFGGAATLEEVVRLRVDPAADWIGEAGEAGEVIMLEAQEVRTRRVAQLDLCDLIGDITFFDMRLLTLTDRNLDKRTTSGIGGSLVVVSIEGWSPRPFAF